MIGLIEFKDFKKLVKGMKAVYTTPNFLPDSESILVWYQLLQDIPYEILSIAIQKHMASNKFPPTIAELREQASKLGKKQTDWTEGWNKVLKAIGKYGYGREEEALKSMDELTANITRRLGWKTLCMSENITADRANFRMAYENAQKQEQSTAVLPKPLQEQIKTLQENTIKAIGE